MKTDPRGLEIERRASSIPPAVVHDVFDVSPEPLRARVEEQPRAETPPLPPGLVRSSEGAHLHHSKEPPHPPRRISRPPPLVLPDGALETRLSPLPADSVSVLTAPPTDAPVAVAPPPLRAPQWFAVGAAAVLIVLAGVVLGARTRSARVTPAPASPDRTLSEPALATASPAQAPVPELPTEPPGTPITNTRIEQSTETPPAPTVAAVAPAPTLLTGASEGKNNTAPASRAITTALSSAAEPPPSDPELAPFDAAAAASAIGSAFERAATCRAPTDPGGSVTATLTYAPSGRVTSALVTGAFAGTSIGGCIAGHLRRAKVSAFSGDYVTVKRTIVLR